MAIRFPDAQPIVRDLLKARLAGRTEPSVLGVTVSTRPVPEGDAVPRPYVRVRSFGSSRDSRLNGQSTVRVSVWHRDEGLALDLALIAEALLLEAGSDKVRGFTSDAGPLPTEDPDTGEPLSFFTLTARLRPESLT